MGDLDSIAAETFYGFALKVGLIVEGMPKTERTLEFVAQRLASFSRKQAVAAGPGWIDDDPPTWDWRGEERRPFGVAMHGALAGQMVTVNVGTGRIVAFEGK